MANMVDRDSGVPVDPDPSAQGRKLQIRLQRRIRQDPRHLHPPLNLSTECQRPRQGPLPPQIRNVDKEW
jgi:hypothetical protein